MAKQPIKKPAVQLSKPEPKPKAPVQAVAELAYTRRNEYLLIGIVAVCCIVAYFPGWKNTFVWDDLFYIASNPLIQSHSWNNLKETLTGNMLGNYHPLTMLSLYLDYTIAGQNAWYYHLINLLIHIFNCWLVFRILHKISDNFLASAVACLLFAVHPLHVESVIWACERKDMLYCLFMLLGLQTYLRWHEAEEDKSRTKLFWLAVVFFLLSCLSKAMAVVLPIVLLTTDVVILKRKAELKLIIEKAPYWIIALVTGLLAISAQRNMGADATSVLGDAYSGYERFFFVCYGLTFYWVKMLFPTNLYVFYPYPTIIIRNQLPSEFYTYFALLIVIIIGLFVMSRRNKLVAWSSAYFFIVILPVAQILPIGSAMMADRYFYVSSVGPLFLIGLAMSALWKKGYHKMILPLVALVVLGSTFMSFRQSQLWENSYTLFNDVLKRHPDNPLIMSNVGWHFYAEKDTTQALYYFEKTPPKEITPDMYYAMGEMYFGRKQYQKSAEAYLAGQAKKPDMTTVNWKVATAYYSLNDYPKAIQYAQKSLSNNPNNALAQNVLGLAYTATQNYQEAEISLIQAKELDRNFYDPYVNLSHLYSVTGQLDKEFAVLNEAIKVNPKRSLAYRNLGVALMKTGRAKEAMESWKKGAEADPADGSFDYNIGLYYVQQGNIPEAVNWYKKAAQKGDANAIGILKGKGIVY